MSKDSARFMKKALELAQKAQGWTLPNPMVGAVLVKDGRIIGEGYHEKCGAKHAEIEAIQSAKMSVKGATLFVTMEPCCHFGKTPPCSRAVIKSGIKKVIIAALDPSAKVHGKGVKELKEAGIEVCVGILENEAKELNREFYFFHEQNRPWISLKVAISLDGKIAENRGKQIWLTGKESQKKVHELRHYHQAILVGAGTAISDNPHLGAREISGREPLRILWKGRRRLPANLQVFRDENFLIIKADSAKEMLERLYKKNVISVLVEGGQTVFEQFLEEDLVDEIYFFMAPVVLGKDALPFYSGYKLEEYILSKPLKLGLDYFSTAKPNRRKP